MSAATLPLSDSPVTTAPAPAQAKPARMLYGDAVRVLGTIAVVFGHVADLQLDKQPPASMEWWTCNIVNSLARWAVPVYIMLSGALLLDPARTEPASTFYRKRLARLGVPIVFWSAVFMLFSVYYLGESWHYNWPTVWKNLALGQPYPHLHFVFRIAVLYAFTPMFRVFVKHAPRPMLVSTVCILFGVWSIDSVINAYTETSLSALARFAPFVSYYLAGYLLREAYAKREHIKWHVLNFAVCVSLLAGVTGWLCMTRGFKWYPSIPLFLYDFLSPVRIPMALSAWVLLITAFRNRRPETSKSAKLFAVLAPTTLGLYLIHPLFRELLIFPWKWRDWLASQPYMGFLWKFDGIDLLKPNIIVGVLVATVAVYLLSLGSVMLLMRIPFARRVVE